MTKARMHSKEREREKKKEKNVDFTLLVTNQRWLLIGDTLCGTTFLYFLKTGHCLKQILKKNH